MRCWGRFWFYAQKDLQHTFSSVRSLVESTGRSVAMVTVSTLQALHPYTATLLSGTSYTELSEVFLWGWTPRIVYYQQPPKPHCYFPLELSTLERLAGSGPLMWWWVLGPRQEWCVIISTHTYLYLCHGYNYMFLLLPRPMLTHVYMFAYVFICMWTFMSMCVCTHLCPCVGRSEVNFKCLQLLFTLLLGTSSFTEPLKCSKLYPGWLPSRPRGFPICVSCTRITGMYDHVWF